MQYGQLSRSTLFYDEYVCIRQLGADCHLVGMQRRSVGVIADSGDSVFQRKEFCLGNAGSSVYSFDRTVYAGGILRWHLESTRKYLIN